MANVKISELPAATVPLAGSELVPIVQSGTTDQVTVANLTAGRTVNAAAVTATGTVSGATVSGTTVTASGTVSGATVTASGTVSGATVTASGTVSGATVSGATVSGTTITASGTLSGATVTSSGTVSGVTAVVGAGTAAAPSISTTGDSNTGIYFPGADRIGFAEGGVQAGEFDASGNFLFNSGYGSVARAFGCRAWVNFDGTGTVAIRASGNVSSISDNGTGDYTVNFTAAMPDANYAVVGSGQPPSGTAVILVSVGANGSGSPTAPTTSAVRIATNFSVSAGNVVDCPTVNVAVFR